MIETFSLPLLLLLLLLLALALRRILADAPLRAEAERLRGVERDYIELKALSARLEAELAAERDAGRERRAFIESSEARLEERFENLSRRLLEERGRALGEENRVRLDGLLQPLRDQLDRFRTRVDEVHRSDTELSGRLRQQLDQLLELNREVGREASNLATAIKGEAKVQGEWGELIVERIFEASGLEEGREYTSQKSFTGEDGRRLRPDFIVHLPGEKAVVVDAKVSLTAYERSCALEEPEARARALGEHLVSVRRHIEELRQKDYAALCGNRTLDFVIMCIPLEPAWQAAMQADGELLYDLAADRVVVCGPSTLMITLKLIAQIWRRERENLNAAAIADRAGRIYDQVSLVAEALLDARKRSAGATEAVELAIRRLSDGRGNLVGRVEEIRRLGAKVNRRMPDEIVGEEPSPSAE